ncbi:MAG: HEPN domain-containing protein, partial [Candidatus Aenigmarchaeota archaeon]|nr:HEPN domain-containing protein [Candidatus Aenigmarchaeota archaeon]
MKDSAENKIEAQMEMSRKRLKAAKLLIKNGMFEDSINRIYYALFYAAKSMLNVSGYDAKTHSGLLSEFGLRLVKEKIVEERLGKILRKSFELRETSDYKIGAIFGEEEVRNLLKSAEDFIKFAEKFVKK